MSIRPDSQSVNAESLGAHLSGADAARDADSSTKTLVGKLFIVPAIVVCLMLGAAVVVVMFGSSSLDKPATIDELISTIEMDSGDRQVGMLLPSAKESWQAAQELAHRFEKKSKEDFPTDQEVDAAASRLIALVRAGAANARANVEGDAAEKGLMRQHFLMTALGRLKSQSAVELLVDMLDDPNAQTRRVALQALADMGAVVPTAQAAIGRIYPLLNDPDTAVRMVACLTVAALAKPGDEKAVREVAALLDGDREVQWNAAAALSRMGNARGKLVLLNMLDRGFWTGLDLDYEEDQSRVVRKFSDREISGRLRAAVASAMYLKHDADVAAALEKLRDGDPAIEVREAARQALQENMPTQRPSARRGGSSTWHPGTLLTEQWHTVKVS
ncbi:MAG TPA: HEAT repeat domain-containing protein [Phycisphaerae bacterium]|nr:HEAT repeat domain-containing protein [Phycisphaerae bacterium]